MDKALYQTEPKVHYWHVRGSTPVTSAVACLL